jgi:hypothetical protein
MNTVAISLILEVLINIIRQTGDDELKTIALPLISALLAIIGNE